MASSSTRSAFRVAYANASSSSRTVAASGRRVRAAPSVALPQQQQQRWFGRSRRQDQPEATSPQNIDSASDGSELAQRDAMSPLVPGKDFQLLPDTPFHPKTHGHHVATLHFVSQDLSAAQENMFFFIDFALRAGYAMGIPLNKPFAPPKLHTLITVPKGPFVHKEAQENFEKRTSRRSVRVFDANEEVVERWLHYLRVHEMPGVGMRAEIFRHRPLGIGETVYQAAQSALRGQPQDAAGSTDAPTEGVSSTAKKAEKLERDAQDEPPVVSPSPQDPPVSSS